MGDGPARTGHVHGRLTFRYLAIRRLPYEEQAMRAQTDDCMIKLALDTIDLELLRWVLLDEAMSKNPVDRHYHQLARDLLVRAT